MSRIVRVNHSTYDHLKQMRDDLGLRSMDQAVEFVLQMVEMERTMRTADDIQPGDVLTLPGAGMLMVRDVRTIPATEKTRVDHIVVTCAVGRTDEGFELTIPGVLHVDVYRDSEPRSKAMQ